jgi:hypothetical protein
LEVFHMYYNFYMHSYVDKKFHSCKKWVLHPDSSSCSNEGSIIEIVV